jgi:nitrile hydratase accessory protein
VSEIPDLNPIAEERAAAALVCFPGDATGPVFREPWEAQAFAIVVALHERGVFTWTEWATVLGDEIRRAQATGDPDSGDTYYRHWLAALERIVTQRHITDGATLARFRNAWERAADSTPHGTPIELRPDDFEA